MKGSCTASSTESKLCSTLVLLDEIQFTVVFKIKVAQVVVQFDMFLK